VAAAEGGGLQVTTGFYRALEDRFRGSRDVIKSRFSVYLPFVLAATRIHPGAGVLDLGCGRGEWLELLREHGIPAQGVDLDEGMLAACREIGLAARNLDALQALAQAAPASLAAVTGMHLAEHLPFGVLVELVRLALRALTPAGLLILETPNPENILVGTSNFYLDPTHRNPLPPALLAFVAEYHGYGRVRILRLNAPPPVVDASRVTLADVLQGSSMDYAVLAQREHVPLGMSHEPDPFTVEDSAAIFAQAGRFQSELDQQAGRFQSELDQQAGRLQSELDQQAGRFQLALDQQAGRFQSELDHTAQQARTSLERLSHVEQRSLDHASQIELVKEEVGVLRSQVAGVVQSVLEANASVRASHAALAAVLSSRSWRLTRPLRWIVSQLGALRRDGALARVKAAVHKPMRAIARGGARYVHNRPRLRVTLVRLTTAIGVHQRLNVIYVRALGAPAALSALPAGSGARAITVGDLSPRARRLHARLLKACGQS
jgi:SAM-dependent methyltransferase